MGTRAHEAFSRNMARFRRFTPVEEPALVAAAQAGDLKARDRLLEGLYPFVWRQACRYDMNPAYPWLAAEDYFQEGVDGLLRALDKFDPAVGVRFLTYAGHWSAQRMGQLRRRNRSIVSGVPPVVNPKYEHHVAAALAIPQCDLTESATDREENRGRAMVALVDHREPAPEDALEQQAVDAEVTNLNAAIDRIGERFALVLRKRLAGQTFQQVGMDLGVTRERVRQLEVAALVRLRTELGLPPGRRITLDKTIFASRRERASPRPALDHDALLRLLRAKADFWGRTKMTTKELCEHLDCHPRQVRNCVAELVQAGRLAMESGGRLTPNTYLLKDPPLCLTATLPARKKSGGRSTTAATQ